MTISVNPMNLFPAAIKYCTGTQDALSRDLKVLSVSCKWMNAVRENAGKSRLSLLDDLNFTANQGRAILGFTCLPNLLSNAYTSIKTFSPREYTSIKAGAMVESVSDAASATLSAVGVVLSRFSPTNALCKPIQTASGLTSVASDIASAAVNIEKGSMVHRKMKQTDECAEKTKLKEDRTTYLLKSISKVTAVVGAAFGAMAFAAGAPIISLVAALSISWVSATTGLAAKIWETSLDRKPEPLPV